MRKLCLLKKVRLHIQSKLRTWWDMGDNKTGPIYLHHQARAWCLISHIEKNKSHHVLPHVNNSSPIHLQELDPLGLKPYYDMVLFLIRCMIDFTMNLINKIPWIHWIWNDKPKCHHTLRTLNNFSHKITLIWIEMEGPNPWEGYKPNN